MSTTLTLNARQQALLVAMIRNMTAEINWDAVATEAGYPTAKSARDNWGHTRKKIEASSGAEAPAKATSEKRKGDDEKTPVKKKAKKVTPLADEDDEEESKGEVKPETQVEDDDDV